MPYYRHRGDPGFFDVLGTIGKGIVGAATGFVRGGPLGALTGAIGGVTQRGTTVRQTGPASSIEQRLPPPGSITRPGPFQIHVEPTAILPGGRPFIGAGPTQMTMACPKGMRPNRSSYHLRDGTFVPKGSRCVPYRRTNPANARALRRSIRRVEGFERLVKRNRKSLRKLSKI